MRTGVNSLITGLSILWALGVSDHLKAQDIWHNDFRKAVSEAQASAKYNLLIFTGSEWDPWSRKLTDEVLTRASFVDSVGSDFSLSRIDLPRTPKRGRDLDGLTLHQYETAERFRIHAFPSIFLCTPEGIPFGLIGYNGRGMKETLEAIRSTRYKYLFTLQQIQSRKGVARAIVIDDWLRELPEPLQDFHQDKMKLVIESDPQNLTGLWFKYSMRLLVPEARSCRYNGKLDQAEAIYLRIISELKPEDESLQEILYELADVYFQRKDYPALLRTLEKAIDAYPDGVRMPVLKEMMRCFTKQAIFVRLFPNAMREVSYDHTKVKVTDNERLLLRDMAISDGRQEGISRDRSEALKQLADELLGAPRKR